MKLNTYQIKKRLRNLTKKRPDRKVVNFLLINIFIIAIELIYLSLRFRFINEQVPFFYSHNWGTYQLGPKSYLFYIPLISALFLPIGVWFYSKATKYFFAYAKEIALTLISISNFVLGISIIRIIFIASKPFEPLLNPLTFNMSLLFISVFLLTNILAPVFIRLMKSLKIVTYPQLHNHPGMALKKPSARGGGVLFGVLILGLSVFFQFVDESLFPILIGIGMLSLVSFLDDYQNTHIRSKLRILEKPILRLGILLALVLLVTLMGIQINQIGNPFGEPLVFDNYKIVLLGNTVSWVSVVITSVWIVWVLNVMSWSNGVDGQYGGIVGISFLVISLLALRFDEVLPIHEQVAKFAMVAAAISFAITRFNWYPSKIMWGFGATIAAFLLTTLSILIGAKVGATMLVILVPFLDGCVTFFRRISQKKSPFKGDRGHLHHLLNKRGWGVRRISVFYWGTTLVFGLLVLFTAERTLYLVSLTSVLIVAIAIVTLNLTTDKEIQERIRKTLLRKH